MALLGPQACPLYPLVQPLLLLELALARAIERDPRLRRDDQPVGQLRVIGAQALVAVGPLSAPPRPGARNHAVTSPPLPMGPKKRKTLLAPKRGGPWRGKTDAIAGAPCDASARRRGKADAAPRGVHGPPKTGPSPQGSYPRRDNLPRARAERPAMSGCALSRAPTAEAGAVPKTGRKPARKAGCRPDSSSVHARLGSSPRGPGVEFLTPSRRAGPWTAWNN